MWAGWSSGSRRPTAGPGSGAPCWRGPALAEADPDLQRLCLQVFADNPRAVRLYEATGYRVEGRLRGEVREEGGALRDVVLMARDVAGPAGP